MMKWYLRLRSGMGREVRLDRMSVVVGEEYSTTIYNVLIPYSLSNRHKKREV